MRIAIISDIHANFEALKSIENEIVSSDVIMCLGDILGYYCQVNDTIEWVRKHVQYCVLGNHDYFILQKTDHPLPPAVLFGIEYANKHITTDHFNWLKTLPFTCRGTLEESTFLLCHGSPWDPLHCYLYENNPDISKLAKYPFNIIAFGQTHRCYINTTKSSIWINPGSVGQSRDHESIGCASAIIYDTKQKTVHKIIKSYDVHKVINMALRAGADMWIHKYLTAPAK